MLAFDSAAYHELVASLRRVLREHYGLTSAALSAPHAGYASLIWKVRDLASRREFFAKVVRDSDRPQPLESEVRWMDALAKIAAGRRNGAKRGVRVPTIQTSLAQSSVLTQPCSPGYSCSLVEALEPNRHYDFLEQVPSRVDCETAARALHDLHELGAEALLAGTQPPSAEGFVSQEPGLFAELPQVVLHGDFHPANLAFSDSDAVGVFDFEYARLDMRVWDIAYATLFFCVDWGSPEPSINSDQERQFISAYDSACGATIPRLVTDELRVLARAQKVICEANVAWCEHALTAPAFVAPAVRETLLRLQRGSLSVLASPDE